MAFLPKSEKSPGPLLMIAEKQTGRGANWGGRTEMRGGFDGRRLGFIRACYAHQTLYFCLDSAISQEKGPLLASLRYFCSWAPRKEIENANKTNGNSRSSGSQR